MSNHKQDAAGPPSPKRAPITRPVENLDGAVILSMHSGKPAVRDVTTSPRHRCNGTVKSKTFTRRSLGERPVTVMLSAAKHLALLFLGGKVQSEILRSAPLRSE